MLLFLQYKEVKASETYRNNLCGTTLRFLSFFKVVFFNPPIENIKKTPKRGSTWRTLGYEFRNRSVFRRISFDQLISLRIPNDYKFVCVLHTNIKSSIQNTWLFPSLYCFHINLILLCVIVIQSLYVLSYVLR